MPIRIVIADDHRILRQGVARLLADQLDFEIVGEANDGREAVELAARLQPDVVLMDVTMPELNGIDAAARLRSQVPSTRVLAMSMHIDTAVITRMLEAGATGYIVKGCSFEDLCSALRATAENRPYLSPQISGEAVSEYFEQARGQRRKRPALTPREREVLQLLAEGKPTKGIASALGLSTKTVENHRKQLRDKLGMHSIAELTKYAIREGLTDLEH
jgi:DNA-binding NarL/FixJ family response regulator